MLLFRDLGDFARPICKSAQKCSRAIYCGRATKFPVWYVPTKANNNFFHKESRFKNKKCRTFAYKPASLNSRFDFCGINRVSISGIYVAPSHLNPANFEMLPPSMFGRSWLRRGGLAICADWQISIHRTGTHALLVAEKD